MTQRPRERGKATLALAVVYVVTIVNLLAALFVLPRRHPADWLLHFALLEFGFVGVIGVGLLILGISSGVRAGHKLADNNDVTAT